MTLDASCLLYVDRRKSHRAGLRCGMRTAKDELAGVSELNYKSMPSQMRPTVRHEQQTPSRSNCCRSRLRLDAPEIGFFAAKCYESRPSGARAGIALLCETARVSRGQNRVICSCSTFTIQAR